MAYKRKRKKTASELATYFGVGFRGSFWHLNVLTTHSTAQESLKLLNDMTHHIPPQIKHKFNI